MDGVAWIMPASQALVENQPVRWCRGSAAPLGTVLSFVAFGEGWDGGASDGGGPVRQYRAGPASGGRIGAWSRELGRPEAEGLVDRKLQYRTLTRFRSLFFLPWREVSSRTSP